MLFSVFEKMKEKMEEIGQTITGFKAKIASWGRGIGLRGNRAIQEGYGYILNKLITLMEVCNLVDLFRGVGR